MRLQLFSLDDRHAPIFTYECASKGQFDRPDLVLQGSGTSVHEDRQRK